MNIRHLRQIIAIRDHGSFAKAAEALHLAQPALSKSMTRIEGELGLTIFTRTSTGSELTPMGEMIAERAERVMAATNNLARDAALVAGGEEGTVRLGIGGLGKEALLPQLLLRIVEAHPRLRLQIEVGAGNRLLPLVQRRELDLALCLADPSNSTLAYVETMRSELTFVASPAHSLASEPSISIERLAAFPCAGPNTPGYTASAFLGLASASDTLDAYTANDPTRHHAAGATGSPPRGWPPTSSCAGLHSPRRVGTARRAVGGDAGIRLLHDPGRQFLAHPGQDHPLCRRTRRGASAGAGDLKS